MITKIIGDNQPITYRAVNTDFDKSGQSLDVTISQQAEESGDRVWILDAIQYSYRPAAGQPVAPITGGLVVKIGDNVKFDIDISDSNGSFNLHIPSQTDKDISVTLRAGGNGIIGKLNVQWHLEPAV